VQLLQTLLALLFVRHVHVWILQQYTHREDEDSLSCR
jgi:hypothetical protein